MPSWLTPSTCCSRRTRELCSPQTNAAVSTTDSDTGKAATVVVTADACVVVTADACVVVATGACEVVGDASPDAVVVVATPLAASSGSGSGEAVIVGTGPSSSPAGTRTTTGDPFVTKVPAAGTCSTTRPAVPSRPSTTSTMVGEPMVLRTPAANWADSPTTEGTSTSTGAWADKGCSTWESPHPEETASAITIAAMALIT